MKALASAAASNGLETRLYIQQFMISTAGKEWKWEGRAAGGEIKDDPPRQTLISGCRWETPG